MYKRQVQDAIDALRGLDEDFESIYYVYTTDVEGALTGVLSMRSLVVAEQMCIRDRDDEDTLDVVEQGDSFAPAFFHAQPLSLRTKLSC